MLEVGPHFVGRVTGMCLFDYVAWVDASRRGGILNPLTLPPVQRSALWRPRQILNLWRSLLAGMPIGALYLSPPGEYSRAIGNADGRGATTKREGGGYDLLDGQQRTSAMMLAVLRPADAGKCVWIAPLADGTGIEVHLTTRSHPFGFTREDEKLSLEARRTARAALEAAQKERRWQIDGIADHKLFDWHVSADVDPEGWPPMPRIAVAGGVRLPVAPLPTLVRALHKSREGGGAIKDQLAHAFRGQTLTCRQLGAVEHALAALAEAEVALILAKPQPIVSADIDPDWALTLFERIGAGGTPLSGGERLYSIFKHHAPYMHDAATQIEERNGRIMPPVDIAVTAICISAAGDPERPKFDVPEASDFGWWMRSDKPEHKAFRKRLERLIKPQGDGKPAGTLPPAFERVRSMLTHSDDPRRLPPLLVASLRPELLRTLVYWAVLTGDKADVAALDLCARGDVLRFALFWHLCVTDPKKAGWKAMQRLRREANNGKLDAAFPWLSLVEALTDKNDESAIELVQPELIRRYGTHPSSPRLRSWDERFHRTAEDDDKAKKLFARWWKASDLLLWLQRDYLHREFGGYEPSFEREEDRPVDLDHIQPRKAFDFNWNGYKGRFDGVSDEICAAFHDRRWYLGDSIGNYRWVSSSVNRADGDSAIAVKLGLDSTAAPLDRRLSLTDCRIDDVPSGAWMRASGAANGRWTDDRIEAWQAAVEERAIRLYETFWREAGFDEWVCEQATAQGKAKLPEIVV